MTANQITISELGRIVTGKTPSTAIAANFGGNFPFVTPSDLDWKNYYCRDTERTVSELAKEALPNQFIPAGSILVTCIGNTIGKSGIAASECLTNQQINSIIPFNGEESKFIYYLLINNIEAIRQVGLGGGAAMPILNKSAFSRIVLQVPQKKYWVSIGNLLSTYDDLIENNCRRISLLEQSAQLLYREWFVYLRFPGHEHVKVANGVPEGWEPKPLGDLLTLQRGFDLPAAERIEGEFPIYAATGINGYHNKAMVTGPGVITGRSGSLGTVLYSPTDFWPLNTTLWVKEFKRVSPEFARFLLSGLNLAQFNGGVAVPTLNRNDVHRIEVLLPPKTLLDDFTDVVLVQLQQIENLNQYNNKLREARDLLLPRLMNGEIQV